MDEIQYFKAIPETIDCAMLVSTRDLAEMRLPPLSYIGGHHVGWLEWRFDTNIEKLPGNLWL